MVSRETSRGAGITQKHRGGEEARFYADDVSRETSVRRGPENAILQNNPMH
jgi:hypothetical protein